MKIGIIGDLHLKEKLTYSEYIKDGRREEVVDVLKFIHNSFKDCDEIVLMGDNLDGRNNTSQTIKTFIKFLEGFGNKTIYVLAGNHEKRGDGKSAIDFLKEIQGKNWIIITDKILKLGNKTFCPYFNNTELQERDADKVTKKLLKQLKDNANDCLFIHHSLSDSFTTHGQTTNDFNEIVLPRDELKKHFKQIVGGHIHKPHLKDDCLVTGSIFTNEVGEINKYIWKLEDDKFEQISLPVRPIHKLENPTEEDLKEIPNNAIVRAIFNKKTPQATVLGFSEACKRFDAYMILETFKTKRKKVSYNPDIISYNIEELLDLYAKNKGINVEQLRHAWEMIK
jgi:DNA repair exonuclease SbcCD nuclease subunit